MHNGMIAPPSLHWPDALSDRGRLLHGDTCFVHDHLRSVSAIT
jgi:hypothetical protein